MPAKKLRALLLHALFSPFLSAMIISVSLIFMMMPTLLMANAIQSAIVATAHRVACRICSISSSRASRPHGVSGYCYRQGDSIPCIMHSRRGWAIVALRTETAASAVGVSSTQRLLDSTQSAVVVIVTVAPPCPGLQFFPSLAGCCAC